VKGYSKCKTIKSVTAHTVTIFGGVGQNLTDIHSTTLAYQWLQCCGKQQRSVVFIHLERILRPPSFLGEIFWSCPHFCSKLSTKARHIEHWKLMLLKATCERSLLSHILEWSENVQGQASMRRWINTLSFWLQNVTWGSSSNWWVC